jgi:hypothetical protein
MLSGNVLANIKSVFISTCYNLSAGPPERKGCGEFFLKTVKNDTFGFEARKIGDGFALRGEFSKAVAWYTKAAEKGLRFAHVLIGNLYSEGGKDSRKIIRKRSKRMEKILKVAWAVIN